MLLTARARGRSDRPERRAPSRTFGCEPEPIRLRRAPQRPNVARFTGHDTSPSVAGQTFRAADRVLRATDFERIYRSGRRLVCPSYAVFVLPNGIGRSRLGLTVTRKFGGAVKRNRNKRIVREIFRRNR